MEKLYHCFTTSKGSYQPNDYVEAETEEKAIAEFICRLAQFKINHTGEVSVYEIKTKAL